MRLKRSFTGMNAFITTAPIIDLCLRNNRSCWTRGLWQSPSADGFRQGLRRLGATGDQDCGFAVNLRRNRDRIRSRRYSTRVPGECHCRVARIEQVKQRPPAPTGRAISQPPTPGYRRGQLRLLCRRSKTQGRIFSVAALWRPIPATVRACPGNICR